MAKKVIELTKEFLDRYGWTYEEFPEPDEKQGVLGARYLGLDGEAHVLLIDPIEEKSILVFRAPQVVMAPMGETPKERLDDLLFAMGAFNFGMMLGAWGYDPKDGEVTFKFALPTHGEAYEYEDFEHCMAVLQAMVSVQGPKLRSIVAGEKSAHDILVADGFSVPVPSFV